MVHLHRSGTFPMSDPEPQALQDATWPPPPAKLQTSTYLSTPLNFWTKKKQRYGSWWIYTHIYTSTKSHSRADTHCTMYKHTICTSMDHAQFMSLWRSSNHNTHTGHTRHTHFLQKHTELYKHCKHMSGNEHTWENSILWFQRPHSVTVICDFQVVAEISQFSTKQQKAVEKYI